MVPLRRTNGFFFFIERGEGKTEKQPGERRNEGGKTPLPSLVRGVPAYRRHAASREPVGVLRSFAVRITVSRPCLLRACLRHGVLVTRPRGSSDTSRS
ncbi:hypothetical protein MRX96_056376 [Rhipicephalus microplus]